MVEVAIASISGIPVLIFFGKFFVKGLIVSAIKE